MVILALRTLETGQPSRRLRRLLKAAWSAFWNAGFYVEVREVMVKAACPAFELDGAVVSMLSAVSWAAPSCPERAMEKQQRELPPMSSSGWCRVCFEAGGK